ncbi:tRNA lysidine(34) synthetase TilS [Gleimia sp. 6138-11-ORH1]|uniref:tRNA lysidine(34) synthetase TilS n=1 Tax=Gleimia sp. 6138-11-ORH1 TaxID=2973937 RepID=UPI002168A143|nr:tRNA lysidine(34) synthetase TilS [Gleimia sp. 6138-11-ORH1]MCS4484674.1 tRNA lysidine(34) synthetase TilS [Gleimia sp. 6138-11-ORH1]
MRAPFSKASQLVGTKPTQGVRAVSLAVKNLLRAASTQAITTWLVGCSGGADSLALTVATADLLSRAGKPLHAVIIDHQLRAESALEATSTATQLATLEIPAEIIAVEVNPVGAVEAAAREARYQAFRDYAVKHFPGQTVGVLLGHTLDDQAETVLLSLARGAGTRALAGIRPQRKEKLAAGTELHFCRPLLASVRRADTEDFCQQLALQVVADPTNQLDGPWQTAAGQPLPRVALRHLIIPQLSQVLGQDVVISLGRSAQLAEEDATYLDTCAQERFLTGEFEAEGEVLVSALVKEAKPIRMRLWKLLFAQRSKAMLTAKHLQELDQLVTHWRGQGPISLPNGWQARRNDRIEKTKHGKVWKKNVHQRIVLELVSGLRDNNKVTKKHLQEVKDGRS